MKRIKPGTTETALIAAERASSRKGDRAELCGLLLLLSIFLAVNLATASRYPSVWMDETLYTDPAVNLLFGHGFTSTAWPAQPRDHWWAGNVPLHEFLLYGWMKV